MCTVYLIRHGQAGSRDNYDILSELGQRQSRLLGRHLAERKISFDVVYSGSLNRQRQTAALAVEPLRDSGRAIPDPVIDERWNEFSLLEVYRKLAPRFNNLEWNEYRKKLSEFLARRGFPYSVIAPVVTQIWNESHARKHDFEEEDTT